MQPSARPRRSVLYMPGSNPRALDKARSLPADGLILDLEDAVAPDAKEEARKLIGEAMKRGGYGKREVIVRVNPLDSDWGQADMAALAASGADAILLPKVENGEMVEEAAKQMKKLGAPARTAIWCMIETPLGVLHAEAIARATPAGGCFVMGTSDLAKDLHATHTRERLPFLAAISHCLLAARAYGLAILDGVHLDLEDEEGLEFSCRQGAELGLDGKTLIHPRQIAAANRAFAPSEEEIDFSRRVIEAHAEAQKEGKGVVVVNGRLIENLHVENARRLVALAGAIDELEKAAAE